MSQPQPAQYDPNSLLETIMNALHRALQKEEIRLANLPIHPQRAKPNNVTIRYTYEGRVRDWLREEMWASLPDLDLDPEEPGKNHCGDADAQREHIDACVVTYEGTNRVPVALLELKLDYLLPSGTTKTDFGATRRDLMKLAKYTRIERLQLTILFGKEPEMDAATSKLSVGEIDLCGFKHAISKRIKLNPNQDDDTVCIIAGFAMARATGPTS